MDRPLPAASTEMIVNATTAEMTKDMKVSAKFRAGRVKVFMVIGVSSDGDFSNTLEERRGLANLHLICVSGPIVREGKSGANQAALPSDVRKASGFPIAQTFVFSEAAPRESWRRSLRRYEKRDPERQSLSAHQAAKPRTEYTRTSDNSG